MVGLQRHENFDYSVLTPENRREIHEALAETTVKHISASPEWFSPMPFDTAQSPSQILEKVELDPAPTTFDEIDFLATTAGGDSYLYIKEAMGRQTWFFNHLRREMNDGHNTFPVTPHGNIADIAFEQASWVQTIGQDDWQDRNAVAISRGVTTIKAFDMAASEVVQKLGRVFLSFPRTTTMEEFVAKYNREAEEKGRDPIDLELLINTNNRNMRKSVKQWMGIDVTGAILRVAGRRESKTFHSAWSGKTDKIIWGDNGKPESITLGRVATGALDIIRHGLVVPMSVWYGEDPMLEMDSPTKVTNENDVIQIQKWQAEKLARHLGLPNDRVTIEDKAA